MAVSGLPKTGQGSGSGSTVLPLLLGMAALAFLAGAVLGRRKRLD
jgi:hypothetical protein